MRRNSNIDVCAKITVFTHDSLRISFFPEDFGVSKKKLHDYEHVFREVLDHDIVLSRGYPLLPPPFSADRVR